MICSQGIPTLIIAIAGIDDAASVAIYGIIKSVMFSHDALWYQILQGPIAIIGGIGFGVLWGWLAKYVPEKGDVSLSYYLIALTLAYMKEDPKSILPHSPRINCINNNNNNNDDNNNRFPSYRPRYRPIFKGQ